VVRAWGGGGEFGAGAGEAFGVVYLQIGDELFADFTAEVLFWIINTPRNIWRVFSWVCCVTIITII
jgi:hypothetical protein